MELSDIRKLSGVWTTIIISLMPTHPYPPEENVWWFDLNFLSLTAFSSGM